MSLAIGSSANFYTPRCYVALDNVNATFRPRAYVEIDKGVRGELLHWQNSVSSNLCSPILIPVVPSLTQVESLQVKNLGAQCGLSRPTRLRVSSRRNSSKLARQIVNFSLLFSPC